MSRYFQNLKKFLPLLKELVSRDIKTKYRRSILGVFWTLLNPLLMMIVLSVVFSHLFRFQVENFPQRDFILIPSVSSENRDYIPMGFMPPTILASNL